MYYSHQHGVRYAHSLQQITVRAAKYLLAASLLVFLVKGLYGLVQEAPLAPTQTRHTVSAQPAVWPTPPKTTASAVVAPKQEDKKPSLGQSLNTWTKTQKHGEYSFYVKEIGKTKPLAQVASDKPYYMASLYKLLLLDSVDEKVSATAWQQTKIASQSYASCVDKMLRFSDNPCAEAFGNALGWHIVQQRLAVRGLQNTSLDNAETFSSSAADMGRQLEYLYGKNGLSDAARKVAFSAMAAPKGAEAVRPACSGCVVYNKTGDLNGFKHDATIVEKAGKAYVVVIMTNGASWAQASEAAGIIYKAL